MGAQKIDELKTIWEKLASEYTDSDALIDDLWNELEKRYSTNKRHYHNLAHLGYMTDNALKYQNNLTDPDTMLFSIFYHDIVYNIKRRDNEEKSAEIADDRLHRLGVPKAKIAKCCCQILATKDHCGNIDNDTNYLVDFDLAILGEDPEKYINYAKKIREEYALYPDFLYNKGRKKVLRHFIDMNRIFKTEDFHGKFELQARENLKKEFQTLS